MQPAWQGEMNSVRSSPHTGLKTFLGQEQLELHKESDLESDINFLRRGYDHASLTTAQQNDRTTERQNDNTSNKKEHGAPAADLRTGSVAKYLSNVQPSAVEGQRIVFSKNQPC